MALATFPVFPSSMQLAGGNHTGQLDGGPWSRGACKGDYRGDRDPPSAHTPLHPRALDKLLAESEIGSGKVSLPMSSHQHLPHHLTVRRETREEPTHLAHRKSLQLLSTELLPTFPQAEASFPAQTKSHRQASELPFLTQRNARRAAGPGLQPGSTCPVGDWAWISTSQIQGDGWRGDGEG